MNVLAVLKGGRKREEIVPFLFFSSHPQVKELVFISPSGTFHEAPGRTYSTAAGESGELISRMLSEARADYVLWVDVDRTACVSPEAIDRCLSVAGESGASIVYADYREHPVIDYELGSVRDNFDFGPFIFFHLGRLKEVLDRKHISYRFAGLYDARLKLSRLGPVIHIREALGNKRGERDYEKEKFSYLEAENEVMQKEMEQALTDHLRAIGAYLPPHYEPLPPENNSYPVEASVVIPVKNRVRTIRDAVESALGQDAHFPFNVIVVDNHSSDGTSDMLAGLTKKYRNLVVLKPERKDLEIGGCWNLAVQSPLCGRFAVQLDSDDLYEHGRVLETMVEKLKSGDYAMVIGSYTLVDMAGNVLAPGKITHREWTDENGRNNALRVEGFGAPRAFRTQIVRQFLFPNVSYGEDYALALRISRYHRIGRIFESLYLCRRWEENSDARLTPERLNAYQSYKDRVRTIEILARQRLNSTRR